MSRIVVMAALVIAGEIVFGLPFHTARFFRPTLLEVFGLTNTELGDLFAAYGVLAMLSYFPGGALADRYSARTLLSASLVATALGGLAMALIPDTRTMALLYAYFGITSIFLFWGALIRATREWGGDSSQGAAFGLLEAGRGVVAAVVAAAAVALFASFLPDDPALATDDERRQGFQAVILLYSATTLAAGILTWFAVPVAGQGPRLGSPLKGMAVVLNSPIVWAQAAVVVCAYCGFKGLDNYSLYAVDVLGMNEVEAAILSTWGAYTRPVAALAAGLIADRFDAARSIGFSFVVLVAAYGLLGIAVPEGTGLAVIYANLFVSYVSVFALRGIYFALLEENRTPQTLTGAAVGLMSLVGFTPEIFFAPVAGRILDASPGLPGHQHYFLFLMMIAAAGIVVVGWLLWLRARRKAALWPSEASVEPSVK